MYTGRSFIWSKSGIMEKNMRRKIRITSIIYMMVFALSLLGPCFATKAYAKDLNVIHEYDITADVQEDGRVRIRYRIDWEVLI